MTAPSRVDRRSARLADRRNGRLVMVAVGAAAVAALLVAVDAAGTGHLHTGDTDSLVHGARVAVRCLGHGTFSACGAPSANPGGTSVGPYPLLQYLPAALWNAFGASDDATIGFLGRLSFGAFVAMVAAGVVVLRRRGPPAGAPLFLLVSVASPLWYYATSGFGEMLATAMVAGLVLAVATRRPWAILAFAVLAGISKETLPYFVVALGFVVGTGPDDRWTPPRRVLVPLLGGSAAALVVDGLFNVFRFGTFGNANYLSADLRVPDAGRGIRQLLLIVASPNAGVLVFWPLVLVPLAVAVRVAARRGVWWWERLRWVGTAVLPLAFFAGLATWYSPFGWIAWGPRLEVPIIPAWVLCVLLAAPAPEVARVATAVAGSPRRAAALAAVGVVASLVSVAPWTFQAGIDELVAADSTCPGLTQFSIQDGAGRYFRCVDHIGWRDPGSVWAATVVPDGVVAALAQVLVAVSAAAAAGGVLVASRPPPVVRTLA